MVLITGHVNAWKIKIKSRRRHPPPFCARTTQLDPNREKCFRNQGGPIPCSGRKNEDTSRKNEDTGRKNEDTSRKNEDTSFT